MGSNMTAQSTSPDAAENLGMTGLDTHRRLRYLKDKIARYSVGMGGLSVIFALVLIFFYLFWVVLPMFVPASMEQRKIIDLPGLQVPSLFMAVEEQGEVAMRLTGSDIVFFDVASGEIRTSERLPLGPAIQAVAYDEVDAERGRMAVAGSDGGILLFNHVYRVSYPNDQRVIIPAVEYPYGPGLMRLIDAPAAAPQPVSEPAAPATIDPMGINALTETAPVVSAPRPPSINVESLVVRDGEERLLLAVTTAEDEVVVRGFEKETSFLDDSLTLNALPTARFSPPVKPDYLLTDSQGQWLYVAARDGQLAYYNLSDPSAPELLQTLRVVPEGQTLESIEMLTGGISLIAVGMDGQAIGKMSQWFPLRDDNNDYTLVEVRDFERQGAGQPTRLIAEQRRRGFITGDDQGYVEIFYATSDRRVITRKLGDAAITNVAISPRNNVLLAENAEGKIHVLDVHNEHPEISWNALWGKVWYESYPEPEYVWQSSSASNDFEPKFSMMPLSFGTLKAAFYAMLFAMPLAIMGAVFTAYFMSSSMRQIVKPTVEVMEALPTVILGFLAGLWLAPLVENNLPGVFLLLPMLVLGMIVASFAWTKLPESIRHAVPAGWESALLVPVVVLLTWLAFALSGPMEMLLFDGNMPTWLDNELGISYDQRNSVVIGLAMGFAVIPTIFSIAEDAIFSVPKHLSFGSLALGATPWQTLVRVVIPTASPGIFSGVMIGMGRAVGETMIVLMATGNTPVMDMSIFQGMRTLSANIAVEMPESEVGSTHFRILFLSGLVLFLFTFVFNTLAEVVRQRLREKYSTI